MPTSPTPLFFPEALQSPGLWNDLGKIHRLSRKEFEWLGHVELASQAQRSQQTPPMLAHSILVHAEGSGYTPLVGSFVLSLTPDDNGLILYNPYDGIRKFDSLDTLKSQLEQRLNSAAEDSRLLNIEARGMEDIRTHHPEKARMIVQAIDMARYYAFNSLHNLAHLRRLIPGTRLDTFLKHFFDVRSVDHGLLDKIKQSIVPICTALVDPEEDLLNSERFIVGSNKYQHANLIAFVVEQDARKNVHFTERFFDQQLDWYKSCLTEPFNVDEHSQAATLIHEFAHLFASALDIATLEARRPFSDLVSPITQYGRAIKQIQEVFQREALSLGTPREELFARWNNDDQAWDDLDEVPGLNHVGKAILKIAGTQTIEAAREAFLDPHNPDKRIDIILRNADSIAFLICEMGRQLDPLPDTSTSQA
ncbi:hypothetical protein SAMN04490195_2125 [Pseudomonas moorei]|uniref:Uncharacterized protein n=1 Tax=Pseudomonas moorei TaxID=395599 RepID=A0A1H1EBF5_9PSED|nr:hypothetical protein SAMN04490195_2125 [Pseudomonas moorei]